MPDTVVNRNILLSEQDDEGILRLTLNDVGRRNALSETMLTLLGSAFADAANNASVRVVILAANGPAFCAGHDLKELSVGRASDDKGRAYFTVIAEVNGVATAAGCQLVASCDLAIASETSKFSTPGVHIGLFCSTPMVALSRNVSNKHAMEMLLTGDMTSATRAAEIGLINRVVTEEDLSAATITLAQKIASKSSLTLATGKRAFYEQREKTLPEAYSFASQVMVENMLARDAEEGINAFIEKRAPKWTDE